MTATDAPMRTLAQVEGPATIAASDLACVLRLAERAQGATTVAELGFTIVNETLSLVPYRQAAFFACDAGGALALTTASGLGQVGADSPYAVWLARLARTLPAIGIERVDRDPADVGDLADGWAEWLPDHVLAGNLVAADGRRLGLVLYARTEPWLDGEVALVDALHRQQAFCLAQRAPRRRALAFVRARALRFGLPALVAALLIPVRMSALAPAEVVALDAVAVAAPQDGVVAVFHVRPNASVKAGDALFSLDDTTLKGRREVASKALAVARTDHLVAQQRAFDDLKSRGDLAAAQGRVREKEAELALIDASLARVVVRADRDGVAVFADANDWIGRPVQTGERVLQIGDARRAGMQIWLPATDALNLDRGAAVRLFLHVKPLAPVAGELLETSYQAQPSPEGVASYRLRARLVDPSDADATPRIGLRGTARIAGDWSTLGYYLLRRPVAAVREWTGL